MSLSIITDREIQFLNDSNRIEGIYEIDYKTKKFQDPEKGHFGAFLISQQIANEHKPLTAKIIRKWQELLTREQQGFTGDRIPEEEIGHLRGPSLHKNVRIGKHIPPHYDHVPVLLQTLIESINENLTKNREKYQTDDLAFSNFLGSSFLRFERIHPFGDGNGRTGRLLANYIATYCNRSILVFPSEMSLRNRYIEAHESEEAMSRYITDRMTQWQKDEPVAFASQGAHRKPSR